MLAKLKRTSKARSSHVHTAAKAFFRGRLRCTCVIWPSRVSQSLVLGRAVSTQTTRVPALARSRRDPSAMHPCREEQTKIPDACKPLAVVQLYLPFAAHVGTTATITLDLRVLIERRRSLPFYPAASVGERSSTTDQRHTHSNLP
jgi:hypothetical protein